MERYRAPTQRQLEQVAALATMIVKNLVEFNFGPVPLPEMEDELEERLLDWIEEVESEQCLAHKFETGFFDKKINFGPSPGD